MTIKFHLGQPKAYSTYLQAQLDKSEQLGLINYSGFKPNDNFKFWYKTNIESSFFNRALRFEREYSFCSNIRSYRQYFQSWIDTTYKSGLTCWLSSENISLPWLLADIELSQKFERIEAVITEPKEFIVIFRNIYDSLVSFYKEYVKQGYGQSFAFFLDEIYFYRESNFFMYLLPGFWGNEFEVIQERLRTNNELSIELMPKFTDSNFSSFFEQHDLKVFPMSAANEGNPLSLTASLAELGGVKTELSSLIESHRYFWSEKESKLPEELFWQKLRTVNENREAISNLAVITADDFRNIYESSKLKEFLVKLKASDEQKFKNMHGTENYLKYDLLWEVE